MKNIILKIFKIICITAIIVCLIFLINIIWQYKAENDLYKKISAKSYKDTKINFEQLKKENNECIGWINIPGTRVDYPIVQGKNNTKYIHTLFNGKQGGAGCIFADYRINPFEDTLTVIYGHRMKDGSMFNNLKFYKDFKFAREHNKITLYTPSVKYDCKIIAFAIIKADDEIYNTYFTSASDVYEMLREKTSYTYNDVTEEDKLILLSTCTYEFKNARYVLLAKL